MIFYIFCGLVLLAIAFYHYNQGFFSAAISAMLVILAGVLAFSWHEVIVERFLKGAMGSFAHPVVLLVLFCVFYVLFRMLFDRGVPGGIMLPAAVDKIGAGLMGLVAAAFAMGIFVVATQEMPFDTSVAGYARYGVADRHAYVVEHGKTLDSSTFDELHSNDPGKFDETDRSSAYVDDLFMNTLKYLSEQGSLSGSQKLTSIHPDFLQEMFAQRLGVQPGATRVTSTLATDQPVRLESIYKLNTVKVEDFLPEKVRDQAVHSKWTGTLAPGAAPAVQGGPKVEKNQIMVVMRLVFTRTASDKADSLVRLSPGSVRLVANHKDPVTDVSSPTNYFPWGTIEKGNTVYLDKPDDFLVVSLANADSGGVDLLYVVDKEGFLSDPKSAVEKIADGVFLEFKRLARFDLDGKTIAAAPKPIEGVQIGVLHPAATGYEIPLPSPTPPKPQTSQPARGPAAAPNAARGSLTSAQQNVASIGGKMFNFSTVAKSNLLPSAVAVPAGAPVGQVITIEATGVQAMMKDKQFTSLNVNPKVALAQLETGDSKIRELSVPAGQVMFQINSNQPSEPWVWAQKVGSFKLVTSDNKRIAPRGAWAIIHEGTEDRLLAMYSMNEDLDLIGTIPNEGQPRQITLAFIVPENVKPKELTFDDQTVKNLTDEPIH